MTSRRAESIVSAASTASHCAPAAPAAPRVRWAAALAVAYLAVAGCAAQADSANHAATQLAASPAATVPNATAATLLPPPSQLYGDLFVAVQTASVYPDQKTFVDATPDTDPATIMQLYQQQKAQPGFSLKAFVEQHFTPPAQGGVTPPPNQTLREHIDWLWPQLTRTTTTAPPYSSLIPMPKPYVVPGGRFREGYYWDTYFTMLGLQVSGREDLVDDMLDNFAHLIDTVGHIPNGNRTYYASRSQPPFFAYMVTLAAQAEGDKVYQKYLPALRKEYAYWMQGESTTPRGQAARHVVAMPDGAVLNRYWDASDTPRDESYLEDVTTAKAASGRAANDVYRDLRAGAESGWDYSSRWLGDGKTLATIRTTSIVPVDLNSLMFHLERTIVKGCTVTHDVGCVIDFSGRAARRALAINRWLWNRGGYYGDYDWQLRKPRDGVTAAALYPLFAGVAWPERAKATARQVRKTLLQPGGLATTTETTGQQWDAPNGWAPLQWIAIEGLRRYGEPALAKDIGTRFLADVKHVYATEGKLVEKYVVEGAGQGGGGGGEYPLQDGFGWTNGVTLKLLEMYGE
ncbi:alpha,alpha-trehalase TreA [Burkholderia multivorans]|uniref:alpha,alpha-trehalase TreA n=1 Tax=Burkholderia multivorans TaxID=87883 RepID=UPI000277C36B|nr:alpha,alpha-trehalase TreA [Burkholderia multivorans]AJY16556.1 trehalase family protein [Burkholderia multivorans ATCC BAA-247]AVR18769.1 alpha,alpha-trehalase TreA [Burkholderia multivorans]EJO62467.1 alpha,alpha-trehalase [Burkholderia multivorans ATCC BAA-247]MBU9496399.1 alpha,alpha-trehalase TreA [Burkholderia multivorans]MCO1438222.1 alpha,alpha-trehalase TreA [Burkholderia multivorans]